MSVDCLTHSLWAIVRSRHNLTEWFSIGILRYEIHQSSKNCNELGAVREQNVGSMHNRIEPRQGYV